MAEPTIEELQAKVSGLMEDVAKLKAKNEELIAEGLEKTAAAKKAAAEALKNKLEAQKKGGDIEGLEKSWQVKLEAREKELTAKLEAKDKWIQELTVNAIAAGLANELAVQGSAEVLLPHLKQRLMVEDQEGKPVTRVVDLNGKPSALTIKELAEEFRNNKSFAPLIVGTKASGAGPHGGAGEPASKTMTREKYNTLDTVSQHDFIVGGGKIFDA